MKRVNAVDASRKAVEPFRPRQEQGAQRHVASLGYDAHALAWPDWAYGQVNILPPQRCDADLIYVLMLLHGSIKFTILMCLKGDTLVASTLSRAYIEHLDTSSQLSPVHMVVCRRFEFCMSKAPGPDVSASTERLQVMASYACIRLSFGAPLLVALCGVKSTAYRVCYP